MNTIGLTLSRLCAALCLLAVTQMSLAGEPSQNAQEPSVDAIVMTLTTELITLVNKNQDLLKSEPQTLFKQVGELLDPNVNFNYIAKNVMGPYWKSATEAQQQAFVTAFRSGLIETYTKGMANFSQLEFAVESHQVEPIVVKGETVGEKASVIQTVKGEKGVNRILYSLLRRTDGQWMVSNVVLNGVNLGATLRSQFAQGVKDAGGDIGGAINNWRMSG